MLVLTITERPEVIGGAHSDQRPPTMSDPAPKVPIPRFNTPGLTRGFSLLTGPLIIPGVFVAATTAIYFGFGLGTEGHGLLGPRKPKPEGSA